MSDTITFEKRVASGLDDVEQFASGSMSLDSSDLELVNDGSTGQSVGIRFTGIDIPQGAIITSAYVQFHTDEVGSAATSLLIRGEDADDAAVFANIRNNVSSRATTDARANWTPAAWTTVGQAGLAQRTSELSAIVQEIVGRPGWLAGNDMAFIITGAGTRTAEAFESGAATAPLLHIEYVLPTGGNAAPALDLNGPAGGTGFAATFTENQGAVAIASAAALIVDADDTEMERLTVALANAQAGDQLPVNIAGLPAGIIVDPASTATHVVLSGSAAMADYQAAVRQVFFASTSETSDPTPRIINVTVNDGIANSSPAVATIAIDRAPDAVGDAAATVRDAPVVTANVLANDDLGDGPATIITYDPSGTGGGIVVYNADGTFTYTPAAGFIGTDSFTYTVADGDGDPSTATVAVTVAPVSSAPRTFEKRVVSGSDDVEQSASGAMSLTSSDLELVDDGSNVGQRIGIRFTAIDIPQGAVITRAYLQFHTDEVGSAATSLLIRGEDVNDAAAFVSAANNVSSRAVTDAANWLPEAWTTVGQAGVAQRTPDLAAIVQEIVNRQGWLAGNDMAFIITGSGRRTADAFEDGAATAPLLHIEYTFPDTVSVADGAPNPQSEGAAARIGFTIALSAPAAEDLLLTYITVNGTAAAGSDFVGIVNGQATIAAGSTSTTVFVDLINDTVAENTEAFTLRVNSAHLATSGTPLTIAGPTGTGTIADNDGAPSPLGTLRVIALHDMRAIGSTDPSGLVYISGSQRFLFSDSEVEESPFSRPINLFALEIDASPISSFSLLDFTDEPTGLAYDPNLDRLYISDDDRRKIFWVDPDNPTVRLGEAADTRVVGVIDPEDVAVNPNNGHLFIANGTGNSSGGGPLANSIVETNSTATVSYRVIRLPSAIEDPEALAYDAAQDVFYVGGGFSPTIWRVGSSGQILDTIDILRSYRNPVSDTKVQVKDLELAPSSDPNDDPGKLNLYVADFGNSHVNDGRLIELDLGI